MSLTIGDPAPNFTLYGMTPEGLKPFSLNDYAGKYVLLLFFPLAGTGVCTKEMCWMTENLNEYAALDAQVFGISVDSPYALAMWAKQFNIGVTLLSDFNSEVSSAYNALHRREFKAGGMFLLDAVSKRAAFVIDKEGTIAYAEVLDNPGLIPDFEAVNAAIRS